jgi:hypothetical protein
MPATLVGKGARKPPSLGTRCEEELTELRRFVGAFGEEKGAAYFSEGRTFEEARRLSQESTRPERERLRNAGFSDGLAAFAAGIKFRRR